MFCKKFLFAIEKAYAITFLATCLIICGVGGYWYFIQDSNIISNIQPYSIVNGGNHVVKAGSTMIIEREYCLNTTEYVGEVQRQYRNHIIYQVPETNTLNTQGRPGCSTRRIAVEVPNNLPTDDYTYDVRITYQINPIKKVVYHMPSVNIHVENEWQNKIKEIIKKEEE